jgi:hypothetical protein
MALIDAAGANANNANKDATPLSQWADIDLPVRRRRMRAMIALETQQATNPQ